MKWRRNAKPRDFLATCDTSFYEFPIFHAGSIGAWRDGQIVQIVRR